MTLPRESAVQPHGKPQAWNLKDAGRVQLVLGVLCVIGFGLGIAGYQWSEGGSRRFMFAYLVAFAFCLSLSLGALFFVIIQHLSRASWSVVVRRPAETLAANFPIVAVMFLPIALSVMSGNGELYPWARFESNLDGSAKIQYDSISPETSAHESVAVHSAVDELGPEKRAILQPAFFVGRWVVFLLLWSGLGCFFWWNSVRQDRDHSVARTLRMERFAAPAALLYGASVTWAAFDLLMSLNPSWQSTMFGVYYFAGSVVGGLSLITLSTIWLRWRGQLPPVVGTEHYLDFGRLMFGFVFFWGYIAFSQYMLLWYASVPIELTWLRDRGATTAVGQTNAWSWVILFLLFGHFLAPFAGIMSRHIKKRPGLLAIWALWLLFVHFVDLTWVVMPEYGPGFNIGGMEFGTALSLFCIFLLTALFIIDKTGLVPVGDPRLSESMHHESAY